MLVATLVIAGVLLLGAPLAAFASALIGGVGGLHWLSDTVAVLWRVK